MRVAKAKGLATDEIQPGLAGTKEMNHESNESYESGKAGTADSAKFADKDKRLKEGIAKTRKCESTKSGGQSPTAPGRINQIVKERMRKKLALLREPTIRWSDGGAWDYTAGILALGGERRRL